MSEKYAPQPELIPSKSQKSIFSEFSQAMKNKLSQYIESRRGFWKEQDFLNLLNRKHDPPREVNPWETPRQKMQRRYTREWVEYQEVTKDQPVFTYNQTLERNNLKINVVRSFDKEQPNPDAMNWDTAYVALEFDNGTEIKNIEDYFPPGWKIAQKQSDHPGLSMSANKELKQIEIPRFIRVPFGERETKGANEDSFVRNGKDDEGEYEVHEYLKTKGAILTILHEAGHAFNQMGMNESEAETAKSFRMVGKASFILGDNSVWEDKDFQLGYVEHVIQEERDAWYYALRVFRELEQEGFQVEEMTNREIIALIKKMLTAYETHIKPNILSAG